MKFKKWYDYGNGITTEKTTVTIEDVRDNAPVYFNMSFGASAAQIEEYIGTLLLLNVEQETRFYHGQHHSNGAPVREYIHFKRIS